MQAHPTGIKQHKFTQAHGIIYVKIIDTKKSPQWQAAQVQQFKFTNTFKPQGIFNTNSLNKKRTPNATNLTLTLTQ